jgi:hypothetical protein
LASVWAPVSVKGIVGCDSLTFTTWFWFGRLS